MTTQYIEGMNDGRRRRVVEIPEDSTLDLPLLAEKRGINNMHVPVMIELSPGNWHRQIVGIDRIKSAKEDK